MKVKSLIMVLICMVFVFAFTACELHLHKFESYSLTVNPTETEKGSADSICSCGMTNPVEVPALNDASVWTVKSETESTCSVAGTKVYASVYGEVTITLPLLEHEYSTYSITVNPTETEKGSADFACSCGAKTEVEVPALNDSSVWTVKSETESTCTVAGEKVYTSVYGEVKVTLALKDHVYGEMTVTVDPTETAVGSAEASCSCGDKKVVEVPALNDSSVWTVKSETESTCTVAGEKVYTSVYGEVKVTLALKDHIYTTYTITANPTETAVGSAEVACSCGDKKVVEVPALNDSSVWTVKSETESTCTVAGEKVYTSVYGEVKVTLALKDHVYTTYTITANPTETTVGSAEASCSCGDKKVVEVPALNDASVWTVKSATESTCTVAGEKVYTSVYGEVKVTLALKDHVYGEMTVTVDPSETTAGSAEASCSCGDKKVVEVPMLTDETVWNLVAVNADYNNGGSKTYTSIYGEYVIETAKLVAPYDGKTYVSINLEPAKDGVYKNGVITGEDAWSTHSITLDANGSGQGKAYPFRGCFVITMIDAATGKILVTKYGLVASGETDANGDAIYVKNPDDVTTYNAYVDFETGIIVCDAEQYAEVNMWVPYESINSSDVVASAWNNSLAVAYTDPSGTVHNIFVYKGVTYFNVSFCDAEGAVIAVDACHNAPLVYVVDTMGNVIDVFAYDGTKLVEADGFEGVYTNGSDVLVVSGAGFATLNEESLTYVIAPQDSEYSLGCYSADAYYEIVIDSVNKTFTIVKPMVTITFDTANKVAIDACSTNKNIVYTLPTLTHEAYTFKGWFYDAACTNPVEETFVPTNDVTVYALWKEKVVITLVGVLEGDNDTLYLGEGDIIGEFLPTYGVEYAACKKFNGWFLDETFETSLPEEAEVSAADSGIMIYANWIDIPVYYGTYHGANTYGSGSTRSTSTVLTIDEAGNITGKWQGTVDAYDVETGKISWYKANSTDVQYFWFDPVNGVIVTGYSNQTKIGTDYYTFSRNCEYGSRNMTDFRVASNPETRLVSVPANDGSTVMVLVYNEHLYYDITVVDTAANPLTLSEVKNSKSLIVKNNQGDMIIALAALGSNIAAGNNVALDPYFGTYTNGDETITLDGRGNIVYGELEGTYDVASEGASYGFDVYFNNETVYYELTLNGESFEMNKVMVMISFVTGEGHNPVESQSYNKNVVATLPVVEEDGYVFNGWFVDAECTELAENYVPVADATLYAKFSAPVTLTINYCDDVTETVVITYSVGEVVTVADPLRDGYIFSGWYTTNTYDEESSWVSGSAISEATTIYAKWADAPDYVGSYYGAEVWGNKTGNVSASKYLTIDAQFVMTSSRATGTIIPESYDEETGVLKFEYNGSQYALLYVKHAGLDIIVMNWTNSATDPVSNDIFVFVKGTTSSAYDKSVDENNHGNQAAWSNGDERVVTITFDTGDITFYINSTTNHIYGNVVVEDALGTTMKPGAILDSTVSAFKITDASGTMICQYGKDSSGNIVELDGYQGTYTNDTNSMTLDGVKNVVLNGVSGTYTIADEATLDVYVENCYYVVVLDQTTMTYTIEKPMVELTFDLVDGAFAEEPTTTVNKNISITLPTPTKAGYVFKGWSVDGTVVSSEYTPVVDTTLVAVWNPSVDVTFVLNNGADNVVVPTEVGTVATVETPVYEGYTFMGWFVDETLETKYNNEAIETATTLYAKWMVKPLFVDSYSGAEIWGTSKNGNVSNSKTATINDSFYMTAGRSGQINVETFDAETGIFTFSSTNYLGLFLNQDGYKFLLVNYSSSATDVINGTDYYIYVNVSGAKVNTQYVWAKGTERVVEMVVNDTTVVIYINSVDNVFVPNVTISSLAGDALAVSDLANAASLVITKSDNTVFKQFAKDGTEFVGLDGYQGTYTGDLGEVVFDGAGNATVAGVAGTYVIAEAAIEVTYGAITKTVTVANNAYTVILDATVGTYTNDVNTFVSNGDGTCTLNGVSGTYTKDGMNVTYTVGDVVATILLNADGTYSEKSIFAGLTFTGSYYSYWDEATTSLKVVFADSPLIAGTIYSGYGTSYYFHFTGELVGTTLTLTITDAVDSSQVGKVVVFEISGSTMTVTSTTITNSVYTFDDTGSVSCADFSM